MDNLTELQAAYIEIAETALMVGTLAAVLIVFLLSIIAVRSLRS